MKLPTLYKITSTGAKQEWTVEVDNGAYWTHFGQTGGAIQTSEKVWSEAKNVGRANETTCFEQAELEARALWEKKQKNNGYVLNADPEPGETSGLVTGGVLPLLAHKYKDHASKVTWPAHAQKKLDGHRCIAVVDAAGKCTLWSRTRKPILSMPHIVAAVEAQCAPGTVLDGELFAAGYNGRFEELTSLIRPAYAKPGHERLEYWVYDCVTDEPFRLRTKRVAGLRKPLVSVDTVAVRDEVEMRELFSQYIEAGFEGLMLRDPESKYVGKRSTGLLKVKERDDAEYEIVGVEEGKGKLAGHGILVFKTREGREFKAKMKGDTEDLRKYWEHPEQWIGKCATVAYQGLTSEGIPRFPVALRIREDE
jgi:hypothetical protein